MTRGRALVLLLVASVTCDARPGTAQPPSMEQAGASSESSVGTFYDRTGPSPWDVMFDEVPTPDFLRVAPAVSAARRRPPTEAEAEALRALEAEAERFLRAGGAYRETVRAIFDRDLARRQGGRARYFDAALASHEAPVVAARGDTIARLERFLARYPEDPEYTPDGMFRLGELYYEESSDRFNEAFAAAERSAGDETPLEPDYARTIELYRAIAQRFPAYRHMDGVFYLLGYGLSEMGQTEEAKRAFLALVCHNHYAYAAPYEGNGLVAPLPAPERTPEEAADAPTGYDPYGACEPVVAESRFVSEAWFRIGEIHFDRPREEYAFDFAISAYAHNLRAESDPNYDLALYKIAWTYYRAGVFDEAVRRFAAILDFADDHRVSASGRSSGDLRPEALRQLGQALAYDDWNDNGVPDANEGLPSGIDRARDPDLVPQDRPFAFEVLARLGQVYHEEARFERAIAAWRAAVEGFPMHREVPRTIDWIATAHRDASESAAEIDALAELARYVEGSPWWVANADEPGAQERARNLAETALMRTAFHYHEEAQRVRARCVSSEGEAACEEAKELYARAADSYRGYIRAYPNDPEAYELEYNLAETLFWSERYEDAADEYRAVRDSNRDDRFRAAAARRVVESLERLVARAVEDGRFALQEEAPEVAAESPPRVRPAELPELLAELANAREHYVLRISDEDDEEDVRPALAYNNALTLYRYGYWPQARARLVRILAERCAGPNADESGEMAWQTLRSMALAVSDLDEVRRLGLFLEQRGCTFRADATAHVPTEEECATDEHRDRPQCLRRADLNAIVYREALAVFARAEGSADPTEQRVLYERSAALLVEAVDRNPGDPQAPIALEQAAIALERTGRFESAGALYRRIVDEVGPRRGTDAEEQSRLDAIVGNAYFRLAYNENRFFDFDRAVESYRLLADSPRFRDSTDPRVQERRSDALVNAALILERLQRYDEAIAYFRRVYDNVADDELRRNALYRIAAIHERRGRMADAIRGYREFIDRYRSDGAAGDLVVQAHFRLSEIIARGTTQPRDSEAYAEALGEVLGAYRRSGQPAGSIAAEYAARARFTLDDRIAEFESWSIDVGRPTSVAQYGERLARSIRDGSAWAQQLTRRYDPVLEYRRPTWTIAAYVRQGRVFEILASAVLNAPFVLPDDVQRQLRGLDEVSREEVRLQVEDQVRQMLDEQARPLECVSIGRYALAVRAASAGSIDDALTRFAVDRLQTYGEERIAACIDEVRARDASMEPYRPGEFARAARGQHPPVDSVYEPPPFLEPRP